MLREHFSMLSYNIINFQTFMNIYTLQHIFSSDNTFERLEISLTKFSLIR